ncbi:MAG: hypothetical protein M1814_005011 [Vezdaea aestivalis]|nr:MAG: hypothetical protein M1814_005011 [Vezdaea aestivalis]
MHFALPPRKTSQPPPYAIRKNRNFFSFSSFRRKQLQAAALVGLGVLAILYLLSTLLRRGNTARHGIFGGGAPMGTPEVVIVTILDEENYPSTYLEKIKANRVDYARRHGYTTFFPTRKDYALEHAPDTWAVVPALRHTVTKFKHTSWIFHLGQNAMIMDPSQSMSAVILNPSKLETLMKRNAPVVPPESVIRTFTHLPANQVDLIISQDGNSLSQGAFLLRNWGSTDSSGRVEDGAWARFFLDTWFDPLYRSYNFQKAEGHALEHIVQWHPTILAKLALVPQRVFNSYLTKTDQAGEDSIYAKGDFIVQFNGCEGQGSASCESQLEPFYKTWKEQAGKGR